MRYNFSRAIKLTSDEFQLFDLLQQRIFIRENIKCKQFQIPLKSNIRFILNFKTLSTSENCLLLFTFGNIRKKQFL